MRMEIPATGGKVSGRHANYRQQTKGVDKPKMMQKLRPYLCRHRQRNECGCQYQHHVNSSEALMDQCAFALQKLQGANAKGRNYRCQVQICQLRVCHSQHSFVKLSNSPSCG